MKKANIFCATTLAMACVTVVAGADVRIMPSGGHAMLNSEAGEFSRSWAEVCYTGSSNSWRAWLNPVEVPTDVTSYNAWRTATGGALTEGRVTSWNTNGTLYAFSNFTTDSNLGWVDLPTSGSAAVHNRMKSNGSTSVCVSSIRVYW
ncbi:hypothetical protein ACFL5O_11820 [Myxococcota bacterium]